MKKFVLLLISLLIAVNCAMAKVQEFDIYKDRDPKASKILFDTVIREKELSQERIAEYELSPGFTYAFFVDLNEDGIKEIIGFIDNGYFYGRPGVDLFILHKENGQYKNIAEWVYVDVKYTIKILENKTNGWHDIEVYQMNWNRFQDTLASLVAWKYKYYKGNYVWEARTKDNWDYQCDVSSQPTQSIKHN